MMRDKIEEQARRKKDLEDGKRLMIEAMGAWKVKEVDGWDSRDLIEYRIKELEGEAAAERAENDAIKESARLAWTSSKAAELALQYDLDLLTSGEIATVLQYLVYVTQGAGSLVESLKSLNDTRYSNEFQVDPCPKGDWGSSDWGSEHVEALQEYKRTGRMLALYSDVDNCGDLKGTDKEASSPPSASPLPPLLHVLVTFIKKQADSLEQAELGFAILHAVEVTQGLSGKELTVGEEDPWSPCGPYNQEERPSSSGSGEATLLPSEPMTQEMRKLCNDRMQRWRKQTEKEEQGGEGGAGTSPTPPTEGAEDKNSGKGKANNEKVGTYWSGEVINSDYDFSFISETFPDDTAQDWSKRDLLKSSKEELKQLEDAHSELEHRMKKYGSKGERSTLEGKEFDFVTSEYTYRLYGLDGVAQKGSDGKWTKLGNFTEVTESNVAKFTKGTPCWQNPARSTSVILKCGNQGILDVKEVQTCQYEIILSSPSGCQGEVDGDVGSLGKQRDEL